MTQLKNILRNDKKIPLYERLKLFLYIIVLGVQQCGNEAVCSKHQFMLPQAKSKFGELLFH